jgi:hypothetical protein
MATVCVGDEFTTDSQGKLKLVVEGNPADLAWPYPCAVGTFNGLHRQPNGGMWVAPSPVVAQFSASGSAGGAHVTVPNPVTVIDTATISITNPSTCMSAFVFLFVSIDVDLFLPPGADAEAAVLMGGNELFHQTNPSPAGGSEMYTHAEIPVPQFTGTLTPGQTLAFSRDIQLSDGDGGALYGQDRWTIRAIVIAVP